MPQKGYWGVSRWQCQRHWWQVVAGVDMPRQATAGSIPWRLPAALILNGLFFSYFSLSLQNTRNSDSRVSHWHCCQAFSSRCQHHPPDPRWPAPCCLQPRRPACSSPLPCLKHHGQPSYHSGSNPRKRQNTAEPVGRAEQWNLRCVFFPSYFQFCLFPPRYWGAVAFSHIFKLLMWLPAYVRGPSSRAACS